MIKLNFWLGGMVGILSICAIILNVIPISANAKADQTFQIAAQRLYSLEIAVNETLDKPNTTVTRGGFTAMVIRSRGLEEVAKARQNKVVFSDVPLSHNEVSYIELANELHIISGDSKGLFKPGEPITKLAAVKMLVCALGYGAQAEEKGGWPVGYMFKAAELKLLNSLNFGPDEVADAGFVAIVLDNALDVKIFDDAFTGSKYGYIESRNITLLENLLADRVEEKGIVERTYTQAVGTNLNIAKDEVMIDGVIYKSSISVEESLLGKSVKFVYSNENGEKIIESLYENSVNNAELSLVVGDVVRSDEHSLDYELGEKERTATLDDDYVLLYNNRILNGVSIQDLDLSYAEVRLVDNDSNSNYDYIFINIPKVLQIKNINAADERIFLKSGRLNGSDVVDYGSKDMTIVTGSVYGKEIALEDIKDESYILFWGSRDGRYLEMTVLDKTIEGMVDSINADEGIIGMSEREFSVAKIEGGLYDKLTQLRVGETYLFYTDQYGRIVAIDEDYDPKIYKYGYVFKKAPGKGLSKTIGLKIMLGTEVKSVETKGKAGEYKLYGQLDQEFKNYYTTENVKFNGDKGSHENMYDLVKTGSIIKYKLNSKGLINEIQIPEQYNFEGDRRLNCKSSVFGGVTQGAFGFDNSTIAFFIPESGEEDDAHAEMILNNGTMYPVQAFDLDDSNFIAAAVTIKVDTNIDKIIEYNDNAKISIVESGKRVIDEEDLPNSKLAVYTDGKSYNYITRRETNNLVSEVAGLKAADVVYLSFDAKKNINDFKKIASLDYGTEGYYRGVRTGEEWAFGEVNTFYNKILDMYSTEFINRIALQIQPGFIETFDFSYTEGPAIYVFKQNSKKLSVGTISDLDQAAQYSGNDRTKLFLYSRSGKVKIVVLVKP